MLTLNTRKRELLPGRTNEWQVIDGKMEWDLRKTAVVICDMWDKHWCPDATERVGEMAPTMNRVVNAARDKGALIIHCPSDTLDFYKDHPGRKLAQSAPKVETKVPLKGWCSLDETVEARLPIDDSDEGCDGCPDCPPHRAWSRQIDVIEIKDGDAITDSAEAYYLMRQRGITNVIVMGVHANMCVLGRPFSIRQMRAQGQNVVLMRDMTDAMYNHRSWPYVSHFRGTELVVEHIEKYWCPSITSVDFIGGKPFRFKEDVRKTVAVIVGENEYHTEETLPEFARKELEWRGYQIAYVMASSKEGAADFKNFEAIQNADLLLISTRRRTPPAAMMEAIRQHVAQGRPIIGIRTASHAFDAKPASADLAAWPEFDDEILGLDYQGHYGNKPPQGAPTIVQMVSSNANHLVLTGVRQKEFKTTSHLYKNRNPAATVVPLLVGKVEGQNEVEPVAWVNMAGDSRVFYTSLGSRDDFANPNFRRLLLNGILWALRDPVPPREAETADYGAQWQPMKVPGTWDENSGGELNRFDGIAWYRCQVHLPKDWQGKAVELVVGKVDNAFEAFVNGKKLGGAGAFPPAYRNGMDEILTVTVPEESTRRDGPTLVALRVYDHDGRGGFKGAAPMLRLGNDVIALTGNWDFRVGDQQSWANADDAPVQTVFNRPMQRAPEATPAAPAAVAAPANTLDLPQQAEAPALSPAESQKRFRVADDLEWEQVLAEPQIAQPVFLNFDERGRMWVVEYRQYPAPAGLKLLSRDSVWRAVYDKVPPPPPHHFKGADRITIHEDTDGDGRYDSHKTFVDGLNIVTSVERGRGGVWVLNPPYLLFYADANNDDIPDGDPEVRLSGFGLEDTHSVANSLRWGPDGWLYAAQGSTVTANIIVYGADGKPLNARPIYSQGQNIWRYHPEKRVYEVFSEGGGNAFGCEIDNKGRVFSGHNGGDTRGFHYVQGGYLQKGFEKHGPLSNPYAFGYFPPIPHASVPRFTHNFIIYDSGALPGRYAGKLFGVEPLQGRIVESEITPDGSSFRTRDVSRPVVSDDRWFRPVDIKAGPDGAIYVCDWYDQQVNHYRNQEGAIDVSNGRIYRLKSKGSRSQKMENLAALSSEKLIGLLSDSNRWTRQTALRLLADRRDGALADVLTERMVAASGQNALEFLWALDGCGRFDEAAAQKALAHSDPFVRLWAVRLLVDQQQVSTAMATRLVAMARHEPNLEARNQLAASARRLPTGQGLAIVRELLAHDSDAHDNRMPLLLWWAIEANCDSDRDQVLNLFRESALWNRPLVKEHLLERLMRRFAQPGTRTDLLSCARLLEMSPSGEHSRRLMAGFEAGMKGRSLTGLPDELTAAIARQGVKSAALGLRSGDAQAIREAFRTVLDETTPSSERQRLVEVLGEVKVPGAAPVLVRVFRGAGKDAALRKAALTAMINYDDASIAEAVIGLYPRLDAGSVASAQVLLTSRAAWAVPFARAAERNWIKRETVPNNVVRKLKEQRHPELQAVVEKLWPGSGTPTTEEMEGRIREVSQALLAGTGDPFYGRTLFQNACGACHKLFGQGGDVGPDLTKYSRDDVETMLLSVINPSAEIREGYENYMIETRDGRSLSGFLAEQDPQMVVLRGLDGQNNVLKRADIVEMRSAGVSLMPEGLLDSFDDQQIRDLFAYLRSTQPLVGGPSMRQP